jgi:hypothetical protein
MDQNDLDKLKLLSNNWLDYLNAVLIKLRDNAIKNGHDMPSFYEEKTGFNRGFYNLLFSSYCKKCPFEIEIDYIDDKVHFDWATINDKCLAHYKEQKRKCLKTPK